MSNIKVVVRPRPLDEIKKEKWASGLEIQKGNRRITLGQKVYDPDITLDPTASQEELFEHCQSIIDTVKGGSGNGTIMVYGQTASGKTYSIFGSLQDPLSGIAYKSIQALLKQVCTKNKDKSVCSLSCSILELYNEKINDMLNDGAEVLLLNGFPRECTRLPIPTLKVASDIIQSALTKRQTASTAMNNRSSRSHMLVLLELSELLPNNTVSVVHLFLVDLAGSECVKRSNVTGKALIEAGLINKSLLALKNVILQLSSHSSDTPRPFISYRDSKLTEILQDSIGGTARTLLVACISPSGRDIEETKNTLDYSNKARYIKNNIDKDKLTGKVRALELEVEKLKNKLTGQINEKNGHWVTKEEYVESNYVSEENKALKFEANKLSELTEKLQARTHIEENKIETLKQQVIELGLELSKSRDQHLKTQQINSEVVLALKQKFSSMISQLYTNYTDNHVYLINQMYNKINQVSEPSYSSEIKNELENIITKHNQKVLTLINQYDIKNELFLQKKVAEDQAYLSSIIDKISSVKEVIGKQLDNISDLCASSAREFKHNLDALHIANRSQKLESTLTINMARFNPLLENIYSGITSDMQHFLDDLKVAMNTSSPISINANQSSTQNSNVTVSTDSDGCNLKELAQMSIDKSYLCILAQLKAHGNDIELNSINSIFPPKLQPIRELIHSAVIFEQPDSVINTAESPHTVRPSLIENTTLNKQNSPAMNSESSWHSTNRKGSIKYTESNSKNNSKNTSAIPRKKNSRKY